MGATGRPGVARIFISYRRADAAPYAGRLCDGLVARYGADSVFMDIDTIPPGHDFRDVINGALSACDVVLAVIGPQWLSSMNRDGPPRLDGAEDFVRLELEHALQRAEIRVVPVLVQGAAMPGSRDLPAGLEALAYRNAFELSDRRWRFDVDTLCDALDAGAPVTAAEQWVATHTVPRRGLTSYSGVEDGGRPNGKLDAGLGVRVVQREGDWAKVTCSNGWTAWVDARRLVERSP